MIKTLGMVFGVIVLAVGLLGFVPAATPNGMLLGIFMVDGLHNIVHILTGAGAIAAAMAGAMYTKLFFKVFGVVYALVTVLGFLTGYGLGVLLPVNMADNLLHVAITAFALYVGFGMGDEVRVKHTTVA